MGGDWTFLSNHAHVLIAIGRDPQARIRDVAERVGITERTAQGIVGDLVEAGYLRRERVGRRNRYELETRLPLRHPLEREHEVGELLAPLVLGRNATPTRSSPAASTRCRARRGSRRGSR